MTNAKTFNFQTGHKLFLSAGLASILMVSAAVAQETQPILGAEEARQLNAQGGAKAAACNIWAMDERLQAVAGEATHCLFKVDKKTSTATDQKLALVLQTESFTDFGGTERTRYQVQTFKGFSNRAGASAGWSKSKRWVYDFEVRPVSDADRIRPEIN